MVNAFASATKPGPGSKNKEETNKRQHLEQWDRLKKRSQYHSQSVDKSYRKKNGSRGNHHSRHDSDSSETAFSYDSPHHSRHRGRSKFRNRYEDDEMGFSYHQDFYNTYPRTSINHETHSNHHAAATVSDRRHDNRYSHPHPSTMHERHHDNHFSQAFSIIDQQSLHHFSRTYPKQPFVDNQVNAFANLSPLGKESLTQNSHPIEEEDS